MTPCYPGLLPWKHVISPPGSNHFDRHLSYSLVVQLCPIDVEMQSILLMICLEVSIENRILTSHELNCRNTHKNETAINSFEGSCVRKVVFHKKPARRTPSLFPEQKSANRLLSPYFHMVDGSNQDFCYVTLWQMEHLEWAHGNSSDSIGSTTLFCQFGWAKTPLAEYANDVTMACSVACEWRQSALLRIEEGTNSTSLRWLPGTADVDFTVSIIAMDFLRVCFFLKSCWT